jgi:hypothetical protein
MVIATALTACTASTDVADEPVRVDSAGLQTCTPPRHYRYVLGPSDYKWLLCGRDTTLFNVTIPDQGRALGRATLAYSNNAGQSYFWSTAVDVGAPIIDYYDGDDICPGAYRVRSTLAYGQLDAQHPNVVVRSHQGSSPCTDGSVLVFSGGYLDVWVEDPRCPQTDINVASFYQSNGFCSQYTWKTFMDPINQFQVNRQAGRSRYHVLGMAVGTPLPNPNTVCGGEQATLISQITVNQGVAAQLIDPIPASGGMGHLVLGTEGTVAAPNGTSVVSHNVGANTYNTVTTGKCWDGCCGDAMLAVIQEP